MKNLSEVNNPYEDEKVISCCSIFGMMSVEGRKYCGTQIMTAIANMHDRGNGLGGGFAVYGLYPDNRDQYALHVMYLHREARIQTEEYVRENFTLVKAERIPTRETYGVMNPPDLRRYFVDIPSRRDSEISEEDYVVDKVMHINTKIDGAYVFSSGKDLGVFKGVGFPEDVGRFYCLEDYDGYLWTAHGRFPTNSRAWWGGAHPFSILDWTVVHNGELSSYGTNRRYLEMYGYQCTMHTDTEVLAYAVDLLMRRHGLPVELVAKVFSAPLWSTLNHADEESKQLYMSLRLVYGGLLMNGPFAVIIARNGEMIGLTDRIRLRPMVAAVRNDMLYLSSEESAIRLISPQLDYCWNPRGGEPVIGRLGEPLKERSLSAA